jgi:hypothetical protein
MLRSLSEFTSMNMRSLARHIRVKINLNVLGTSQLRILRTLLRLLLKKGFSLGEYNAVGVELFDKSRNAPPGTREAPIGSKDLSLAGEKDPIEGDKIFLLSSFDNVVLDEMKRNNAELSFCSLSPGMSRYILQ